MSAPPGASRATPQALPRGGRSARPSTGPALRGAGLKRSPPQPSLGRRRRGRRWAPPPSPEGGRLHQSSMRRPTRFVGCLQPDKRSRWSAHSVSQGLGGSPSAPGAGPPRPRASAAAWAAVGPPPSPEGGSSAPLATTPTKKGADVDEGPSPPLSRPVASRSMFQAQVLPGLGRRRRRGRRRQRPRRRPVPHLPPPS